MTHQHTLPPPQTELTSFLTLPEVKYPNTSEHKATGRIITSVEYRKKLLEKEQKKLNDAEQKALKKAERERKKQEKEEQKKKAMQQKGSVIHLHVNTHACSCIIKM